METARDLLAAQPFLAGLTGRQLDKLSYWSRRQVFRAGARVFEEGGRADRFWLLKDGRVALDTEVPGRGGVVVESLGPGAVLGWSWLFPPYRWHFGARAIGTLQATAFDAEQLRVLADQDPRLGYLLTRQLLSVVLDRLQSTRARLLDLYGSPYHD